MSGLVRTVDAAGGFATVLAKGERDAGTLLVVLRESDALPRLYERMPQLDGSRRWSVSRTQDSADPQDFDAYLARRRQQDPDVWIVELDVRRGERFIAALA